MGTQGLPGWADFNATLSKITTRRLLATSEAGVAHAEGLILTLPTKITECPFVEI